jgi:nucleoside-diphosphate-sugar epimerase
VIPLWLTAAQSGKDLQVHGGEQVIDFLWVGTAVDAMLFAEHHDLPGPVNIGSGQGTRILDLAQRVREVTGGAAGVVLTPARGIEVAKYTADIRLMRSLGMNPEADPLQHLAEMAPFYRGPA